MERNVEPEAAALPLLALVKDTSPHQLDQPPGDRQPQAAAAIAAREPIVRLLEILEQPLLIVAADADAGVAHLELHDAPALHLADLHAQLHAALFGEFDGVLRELQQHLADPQGVAEEFSKAVKAAGGTIAETQYTTDKATDFTAILTQIKAKKPDVVFFGGMDAVAGPMIRQMKQLGINA